MTIMTIKRLRLHRRTGFSLAEVVISLAIAAIFVGGTVAGFQQAATRAEWSAYSLAAHSLAMQTQEQVRAATWDQNATPPVDQVVNANFPAMVNILDIPVTSQNRINAAQYATNFPVQLSAFPALYTTITAAGVSFVYTTNYTTITSLSTSPQLRMIQVNTVWPFFNRGNFTNTVVTYRTANQ